MPKPIKEKPEWWVKGESGVAYTTVDELVNSKAFKELLNNYNKYIDVLQIPYRK